ncbi:hypothetical protein K502DRAFT_351460 [Neoconidiobolus thromboides FSU 785]|nr:hypothetical protein K502DRAFT_351460 [Neoconidiobolus thromboides FSU 785]
METPEKKRITTYIEDTNVIKYDNSQAFPPYPTLEDPDKLLADGTTIIGFPIGLVIFLIIFFTGFGFWERSKGIKRER